MIRTRLFKRQPRLTYNRPQPTGSVVRSANGRAVPYVVAHGPQHLSGIMGTDTIGRSAQAVERLRQDRVSRGLPANPS